MKEKYIKKQVPEHDKLPFDHIVWHIFPFNKEQIEMFGTSSIISLIHNTSDYSVSSLHKPISTLIDFTINENY